MKNIHNKLKNLAYFGLGSIFMLACTTSYGMYHANNQNTNIHNKYYTEQIDDQVARQESRHQHVPLIESKLAYSSANKQSKYITDYVGFHGKKDTRQILAKDLGNKVTNHEMNLPMIKQKHPIKEYLTHSLPLRIATAIYTIIMSLGGVSILWNLWEFHFTMKQTKKTDFVDMVNDIRDNLKSLNNQINVLSTMRMNSKGLSAQKYTNMMKKYIAIQYTASVTICVDLSILLRGKHISDLRYMQKRYIKANLESVIESIYQNIRYIRDKRNIKDSSMQKKITKAINDDQKVIKNIKEI